MFLLHFMGSSFTFILSICLAASVSSYTLLQFCSLFLSPPLPFRLVQYFFPSENNHLVLSKLRNKNFFLSFCCVAIQPSLDSISVTYHQNLFCLSPEN